MLQVKELLERTFGLENEEAEGAAKELIKEFGEDGAINAIDNHFNSYECVFDYDDILTGLLEDHMSGILEFTPEELATLERLEANGVVETDIEPFLKAQGWIIVNGLALGVDLDKIRQ